jgi:outer membrane lipoprotein SlyB
MSARRARKQQAGQRTAQFMPARGARCARYAPQGDLGLVGAKNGASRGVGDASSPVMRTWALCAAIVLATSCMRSSTTTTTWVEEGSWARAGVVESVQEVVRRVEGEPVAGALAGALIGGFLFHGDGRASLFGAAAGAAFGAAASQGSAEYRTYQVLVRFDDGERGLFLFRDGSPFMPGSRVTLTERGLRAGE